MAKFTRSPLSKFIAMPEPRCVNLLVCAILEEVLRLALCIGSCAQPLTLNAGVALLTALPAPGAKQRRTLYGRFKGPEETHLLQGEKHNE